MYNLHRLCIRKGLILLRIIRETVIYTSNPSLHIDLLTYLMWWNKKIKMSIMKKLILPLLFVLVAFSVKAQYKPLSSFQNDTTAFIIYNFMERAEEYKGKTMKDLISNLKMPIAYFHCGYDMHYFYNITLYVYRRSKVYSLEEAGGDANGIFITWKNKIPVDLYDKLGTEWNVALYDYLKDVEIKDVCVIIGKNSKYYSKYKKKETGRAPAKFREVKDKNSTFVRFDMDEFLKSEALKSEANDKK